VRGKHEAARECSENDFLTPEIGAIHGPNNTSEAAQAERIVDRLPGNALVLADCSEGSAQKQTTDTGIIPYYFALTVWFTATRCLDLIEAGLQLLECKVS
jgi:hypothetical protein